MSVLKTALANPSRMRGIFRYLLHVQGQREKRDVLERILSPDKLVEHLTTEEKLKDRKMVIDHRAIADKKQYISTVEGVK